MRRRRLVFAVGVVAATLPTGAEAHLVVTGLGGVYDGAAHLLTTFQDIAPVVTLGLYAGRRGPAASRLAVAALPLGWMLGGGLALIGGGLSPIVSAGAAAAALMGLGLLIALDIGVPISLLGALALALGGVRGAGDLADIGRGSNLLALGGMAACAFMAIALAASVTLPIRRFAFLIATRVAGSWAAAVGLLLFGWLVRYGARAV